MNKITRFLLVAAMIAAIGLIMWFPPGSGWYIVGFTMIITGLGIVMYNGKKRKEKKK